MSSARVTLSTMIVASMEKSQCSFTVSLDLKSVNTLTTCPMYIGRFSMSRRFAGMEMLGAESAAKTSGPDASGFATENLRISAGSIPESSIIRRFFLI